MAGGATFAAFPGWYASLFAGFYLALFLILVCLIVRGVAFEFWGKSDDPRWRSVWEWATVIGSGGAALLWGVGWANIVRGVPMNAAHDVTATIWDLLNPFAIVGGLATITLFASHGAIFLTLRTRGDLTDRARALAVRLAPTAALITGVFLAWATLDEAAGSNEPLAIGIAVVATGAAAAAAALVRRGQDGRAFGASAAAIALMFVSLLVCLFPNALPSTTNPLYSLTLVQASSTHYTLTVMTVVAALLVPVVLAYQAWTYWVFRHRLGREDFDGTPTPLAVIDAKLGRSGQPTR